MLIALIVHIDALKRAGRSHTGSGDTLRSFRDLGVAQVESARIQTQRRHGGAEDPGITVHHLPGRKDKF